MVRQRIEYIDAMRGFTMILVVYSHVCNYCLGNQWMGFNDVFFIFRLPCFFFISGWLFEMPGREWNRVTIPRMVRRKFMVQIVPTVIFLLLLAPPPLFFSRLGALKGGYWFTFALFEFFLLCIFSEAALKKWGGGFAFIVSLAAFCYDVFYSRYFSQMGLLTDVLGFLGFMTWRYYLFFYVGTMARRHSDQFLRLTDRPWIIFLVVGAFVVVALLPHGNLVLREYLIFALGGILGLTMVFALFRTFAAVFTRKRLLGRSLQYVGTRTLDIYLLHYFLLPRFLLLYRERLFVYDNRFIEFVVAMSLSLVVVCLCLLVSYVVRLNPFLGRLLFGVKHDDEDRG